MLASRILSELSGLMTLRSKAAGQDKDQLGTSRAHAVLTTKVAALAFQLREQDLRFGRSVLDNLGDGCVGL